MLQEEDPVPEQGSLIPLVAVGFFLLFLNVCVRLNPGPSKVAREKVYNATSQTESPAVFPLIALPVYDNTVVALETVFEPLRWWQQRQRVMRELSENPLVRILDPAISERAAWLQIMPYASMMVGLAAYHLNVAPLIIGLSCISALFTGSLDPLIFLIRGTG